MKILFVCKYNSGRSQMAKGFFNALSKSKKHHAESAGTNAKELIDKPMVEYVVRCMDAVGIDVSKYQRMQLTPKMIEEADKVIMITAKKDWPPYVTESSKVVFWNIEDAKDQTYEFHCMARDKIKARVQRLIKELH